MNNTHNLNAAFYLSAYRTAQKRLDELETQYQSLLKSTHNDSRINELRKIANETQDAEEEANELALNFAFYYVKALDEQEG
jgi:5-methylcytosine-specific restriction endonuclease McrA